VYLINNDPASLYASASRLNRLRGMVGPSAELLVVENGSVRFGVTRAVLEREFGFAARIEEHEWFEGRIPFAKSALRWPGSGDTMYSAGGRVVVDAINDVLVALKVISAEKQRGMPEMKMAMKTLFSRLKIGLSKKKSAELPIVRELETIYSAASEK